MKGIPTFKVRKKTVEGDYKKYEREADQKRRLMNIGLLSEEESSLVRPMRDYIRDFAIINAGGKGVVMDLNQPDLSKAIMAREDFEFLHRHEWVEVTRPDGGVCTVFPAKQFLEKPPRGVQVYNGGLVFKPQGTVAAGEYNLYKGMLVKPDASGSYDLFKALIREVWVQGDEEAYEWVMEWFMHIIAYPGRKVGTSIAIRGEYGDGKSVVAEKLMSVILGDMLLRVTNQKVILGDYNEAAISKLLIVLEEAAFAGDKAAFDRMKEQVTGDTIVVNPKFKPVITVDNHARMLVISNHPHFMHLKPGDRRYTVLESSSAWRDNKAKFDQLLEEWSHGGSAKFVYDALNHPFRKLADRQALVISNNLTTNVSVRQIAHSRSGLERCIVFFLLHGRVGSTDIEGSGPPYEWYWDRSSEIEPLTLQKKIRDWLRDHEGKNVQYEVMLDTIISTLEDIGGDMQRKRPKGRASSGKRIQLPTVRILPPRRQALDHAFAAKLITQEEYEAGVLTGAEGEVVERW